MNSLEFAYWLEGFFELSTDDSLKTLNEQQVKIIREHLQLVFDKVTSNSMGWSGTCGTAGTSEFDKM
jgi:hypothetical protein